MKIHVVQKGDTLWKIAKKYGVNFEELKAMNTQLSNPDMIMPGMKIKVPADSKPVKKEMSKGKYPSEHPYKDESPKPIPVIKEEKKPKEMPKKEMPKKEMPKPKEKPVQKEKPMMPMQQPQMPPVQMQFPTMEQQMQNYYTTVNIPQMPTYQKPKEEPVKKEAVKPAEKVKPQMQQPTYHYPQMHYMPCVPCHPCHPCPPPPCMPMPQYLGSEMHCYQDGPMNQVSPAMQGGPDQYMMESSDMDMPQMQGMHQQDDCGCDDGYGGYQPMPHSGYGMPAYGYGMPMAPYGYGAPQQGGNMPGYGNGMQPQQQPMQNDGSMPQGMMNNQPNMMPNNGYPLPFMGPGGNQPFGSFEMPRYDHDEE
ncbi:SafA/ExsA family spore coat assembly protein [Pontibacillus salicampi]|uniref:SafA/ExsA family spore coat assembly protein n=1 Tax=Pontibacillus salicampi TaxID=1449801 RepID=A0ABV6LJA2_9BACI